MDIISIFQLIRSIIVRHVEHGVVTDWVEMEHLWQHGYKELSTASEEVRSLLTCLHSSHRI
jgi:actin-related protein